MTPANLSQHATAPPRKPPLASKKKGGKEYSKDTSREIATTNTTLNAFVGGKQRSWMTNPGAPIIPSSVSSMQTMSRKRSAAGKQLESATSTAQQSRPNIPPPSGPGNTSTAVVRPPAQVNTAPNSATTGGIQVLPSPAPSEGRPSPTAPSASVQETVNLTDDAQRTQTSRRANAPLQENPEVTRLIEENVGNQSTCSPQFMKPHARDFVENDAKRRKVENVTGIATAVHGSHPMPLTPVTSPGLRNRPVQDHNISNEPSSTARTSITTSIPIPPYLSGHSVDASWQPRASNVTSLQLLQPSGQVETAQQINLGLPSQMHQQQQMNVQSTQHLPQQTRLPPGNLQMVGRRTSIVQNPTSPTTSRPLSINGASYSSSTGQNLQQLPPKASIMDFMTNIGGQQALRLAERVRIEWLCHALAGADWGFITLHQLSCLSVNNKAFLEYHNLIPVDAYLGFDFLSKILPESHNLSPQFLDFFSNFPEPAQSLITKPLYQGIVRDLLPFLRKGAPVFIDILNRCLYRQSSPAAGELVIPPFTCSVVLQRLLWRKIRIELDNGETTSGAELEKKFIAQQFEILKSLGLVPPPQTAQDHQGWLAQQQHAQILANQQVIQNKYPELNRPLQTGVVYPPSQLSPTFQQRSTYQQVRSGGRLIPTPSVSSRQDVSQPQANQIINTGNPFVVLQASVQGGQHTQHFQPGQVNQAQAVALSTSQSPSVVQSPLASTIHTPRLPGNFCQTSVAVRTPTESIGGSGMGNLIRSPPAMAPSSATGMVSRRPSVVSRVNLVDHYISVIGFATQDCSLPAELPCLSREFTVQQEMANRLSVWEPHPGMPGRSKRIVLDRSLIYRLRCVQAIEGKGDIRTESNWVLRETTWPAHLFVQLNNEAVMLRRKHIFNSDLYVDITNQVKAGLNVLKVAMIQDKTKLVPNGSYLLRVEILEARSYTGILNQIISKQVIDKEAAKAAIMDRLKPSEDDDVVVVKLNELTLSIVCPFTMTLIKTPVRGKLCLHTECFDLDNYLISRPRKKPREPPNADSWKCPYCSGDARPAELVVDGFVKELVTQVKDLKDAQDSKEVLIKVDGSWEFKKEETGKGKAPEKKQNTGDEPKKQLEVITIDDD